MMNKIKDLPEPVRQSFYRELNVDRIISELEVLNLIKNKQVDLFEIKRNDDYIAYNYEVVLPERFLTEAEFEKIKRLYKE